MIRVFLSHSFRAARTECVTVVLGALVLMGTHGTAAAESAITKGIEDVPPLNGTASAKGDWSVALGAGIGVRPVYEGSRDFEATPLPLVSIIWKDRVFLDPELGLGAYVYRSQAFRLGVSIGLAPGRDEDDSDHLKGLGSIDLAARAHLTASYSVGPMRFGADFSQDVGGSDGFQIRPSVTYAYPLTEKVKLSTGLSATWASSDYMETFFGVDSAQSVRSGLAEYKAEAGFKRVDLRLGAGWDITEHWTARANAGLGYLVGDAADSPITEKVAQPSFAAALGYKF